MNNDAKILLVEDDEVDIMNVRRAFKKNNLKYPLYVASNGQEALALLRGTAKGQSSPILPQLILLDINMPKMNGLEFLRELRADNKLRAISVFVLTTSNEERDIVTAYNLNVAGYILKPVDVSKFVDAVCTLNDYWCLTELP